MEGSWVEVVFHWPGCSLYSAQFNLSRKFVRNSNVCCTSLFHCISRLRGLFNKHHSSWFSSCEGQHVPLLVGYLFQLDYGKHRIEAPTA